MITTATSNVAPLTNHNHRTINRTEFRDLIAKAFGERGRRGLVFKAKYDHVEYFNSPHGFVLFAHHDDWAGQVDGIHPAALSDKFDVGWASIVEPFGSSFTYATHYLSRKRQGFAIVAAFGRMVHSDDPEAHGILPEQEIKTIEIFDAPMGPIVGVFDGKRKVYVIYPEEE